MTIELPCLRTLDAFLAAGPDELAGAVLWVGLRDQLDKGAGVNRVEVHEIANRIARSMALIDAKVSSMAWMRWIAQPPHSLLLDAVKEGVIVAEQRLCLARDFDSDGRESVHLLRRGRDALASGDVFRYLRNPA